MSKTLKLIWKMASNLFYTHPPSSTIASFSIFGYFTETVVTDATNKKCEYLNLFFFFSFHHRILMIEFNLIIYFPIRFQPWPWNSAFKLNLIYQNMIWFLPHNKQDTIWLCNKIVFHVSKHSIILITNSCFISGLFANSDETLSDFFFYFYKKILLSKTNRRLSSFCFCRVLSIEQNAVYIPIRTLKLVEKEILFQFLRVSGKFYYFYFFRLSSKVFSKTPRLVWWAFCVLFAVSDMNNYHPKILIRRNNLLRKFTHRQQTKWMSRNVLNW